MAKYKVGWTYTIWVEVEADSPSEAFDRALEVEYNYVDINKSGATMELNEHDSPHYIINEVIELEENSNERD